jgi:hypothetical protein
MLCFGKYSVHSPRAMFAGGGPILALMQREPPQPLDPPGHHPIP